MKSKGLDFRVVTSPGQLLDDFAEREKVLAYPVSMEREITPFRDLVAVSRIMCLLRSMRPDIVHAHTPKGGLLGMIGACIARVPVRIYHIRGLPYMSATGAKRRLMMWTERVSCYLAHEVLCVSHSIRNVAIQDRICQPDKIVVLAGGSGNGVDSEGQFNPERFPSEVRKALRQELTIAEDAVVLLFVGRIVRDKGVEELADAWTSISRRWLNTRLIVAGPKEGQDPVSKEAFSVLEGDPRVIVTGAVSDTAPLYAVSDLVVLPTYREGFPNVLLEAASMERPVVATRIPGCIDAVEEGVTGLLVEPRDPSSLADAISLYLDNPQLRKTHGQAGRARVLRDFRQEVIWEAVYGEYRRLLENKGCPVADPVQ